MSILVATDFAACSRTAVRLAGALAHRTGKPLTLVHAIEPPALDVQSGMTLGVGWEADLSKAAELALARDASDFRAQGIPAETRVVIGSAASVILEMAREVRAELIVVGTHGRKGGAQLFVGSVAESVVRESTCPVLVARDSEPDLARWSTGGTLRLAVATDGSAAGRAAMAWAGRLSAEQPCELSLLRIYWPPDEAMRYGLDDPWGGPRRDPALRALLERDLNRDAQALIRQAPARLRLRAAGRESPEAVAEEAAMVGADAVVIGVPRHRLGRWDVLAPGPVLRASALPVLCVPQSPALAGKPISIVRSVLVATDLSEVSNAIIPAAYGLLRAGGGRVELCTVHPVGVGVTDAIAEMPANPPLTKAERAKLETQLHALIPPEAEGYGIATGVSVVEGRFVPECILAAAERLAVDVIAVGTHGRSGVKRAVLGSVAEALARTSSRPILILRGA